MTQSWDGIDTHLKKHLEGRRWMDANGTHHCAIVYDSSASEQLFDGNRIPRSNSPADLRTVIFLLVEELTETAA